MINYKKRLIDNQIENVLKANGAILIKGPRQCGKTTTAKNYCKSFFDVSDPKNSYFNKYLANLDPELVLTDGETPRLIDEWQEAPGLWDATRLQVDKQNKNNLFILTGSINTQLDNVIHSGAGRIVPLKMYTMSLWEMGKSSGQVSLKELFNKKELKIVKNQNKLNLEQIIELTLMGGWPRSMDYSFDKAIEYVKGYVNALIENENWYLNNKKIKIYKFVELLKSLARNEGTYLNKRTLIRDMGENKGNSINPRTVESYLKILEEMQILEFENNFSRNFVSSRKVLKSNKIRFVDSSIALALLDYTKTKAINSLNSFGLYFEGLCIKDLKIYAQSIGAQLYQYRDSLDQEIDAIIELESGKWGAFEIKLSGDAEQTEKGVKNLLKFKEALKLDLEKTKNSRELKSKTLPEILVLITGIGDYAYQRPDGIYVVPINMLKN